MPQAETPAVEIKTLANFEIKDAAKGEVEAIIATLGVVDGDGDIVMPSAIPDGAPVKLSAYGHDIIVDGAAPVGKGKVTIEGDKAVFRGRYFLSTSRGTEAFHTAKELGTDQQWSWGYQLLEAEVPSEEQRKQGAQRVLTKTDAFEVSPVIRGAGIGTRTLALKAAESAPDDAEAKRKAEEEAVRLAAEAERKRLATEIAEKELAAVASAEFDRFQRTRRWLGAL